MEYGYFLNLKYWFLFIDKKQHQRWIFTFAIVFFIAHVDDLAGMILQAYSDWADWSP